MYITSVRKVRRKDTEGGMNTWRRGIRYKEATKCSEAIEIAAARTCQMKTCKKIDSEIYTFCFHN